MINRWRESNVWNKVKELWKDRHNQLQYAKWLMIYSKPYIGRIALVMSFGLFSTVASLFMVKISKNIIDNATFGNGFVRLLVIYLILMLAMQAFSVMDTLISAVLTEKFSFGIRIVIWIPPSVFQFCSLSISFYMNTQFSFYFSL